MALEADGLGYAVGSGLFFEFREASGARGAGGRVRAAAGNVAGWMAWCRDHALWEPALGSEGGVDGVEMGE